MAFFAPHFATSEGFSPFFSIINDFDGPTFQSKPVNASPATHPLAAYMAPSCTKRASEPNNQRTSRRSLPTFKPNFDVRETADAYELHGELAGLKKKDVSIEFTDAQTLVVHGRVERVYTKSPPAKTQAQHELKQVESAPSTERDGADIDVDSTPKDGAEKQTSYNAEPTAPRSPKPQKATVEDTVDEDDRFSVTSMSSTRSASPSYPEASVADIKKSVAQAPTEVTRKPESDEAMYWVQERTVGEFSRTFSFPRLIRQDEVHASLEDGILTVVIPKAHNENRRIVIF
ncbi:30 kDa heat shock protein [Ceratocystis fimbriata CBS 114723]|uniref:30 kDa heat shock protein n=1 Tax=Ceratocystis fimbriata CBS 114723 TaxID=1035309 RepID=A0A2C5XJI1_9PEZI|nr:30 kDa heat shock protein [Ceratocystis fimbriata CBS 114723]